MEDLINLISNKVIEDSDFKGNIPIEFKITDNIKEEIDNYYENNKHSNTFQDFSDLNGVFLPPNNTKGKSIILINNKELQKSKDNNCQIICTLYHELTHAIDYYNYCNDFFDGDYNKMWQNELTYSFYIWTEFNAKRKSYIFYRNFLQGDKSNSSESLDLIIKNEIPLHNNDIKNKIKNYKGEYDIIYYLIHYLARYMVWDETFEINFANFKMIPEEVKTLLGNNLDILYDYLKKHKNYSNNINDYNELTKIIEDININVTMHILENISTD